MRNALLMAAPLFVGWLLDMLIGDPAWMPHPVRLIKRFINSLEPVLFGAFPQNPRGERHAGNLFALLVPLVSLLVAAILLACARLLHPGLWLALETMLCYQLISTRNFRSESMRVCGLLESREEHGDLSRARLALSRISDCDTGKLNRQEITRTAIETAAENTNDSIIAPMFYITIGGGAMGVFYKAVSTLKTMVVHENAKHRYFGMASARLYDACGFIPARITSILMILAARILRFDAAGAARGFKCEVSGHESPNNAHIEAVFAGALGIKIGESGARQAEPDDIRRANRLMVLTSFFGVLGFSLIKLIILLIMFGR